ncbi:adenylate kinase family protein [Candidatus Cardinium hertigii]|jgi:adenylate kinase|uniref:Adenylate kinase n=1 Tax=Candidatus Cardinium hertigii TaxID=247481 RepID=A0A3N2QCG4_9BACT|nr:nucleoside monophosphate kinase [Candidatus Cardinium hertigii]ROT47461.1 nucleoside monophosphate kinase [Candidatus Cardinium hertigii]
MLNIILLGPPGSGKGTQTERLIQKHDFALIAVGALLRKKIAENSPDKALIERYIHHGQLVPDSLTFTLVEQLVREQCATKSLLFDGFPRTILQATFLDDLLATYNTKIDGVIFFDVSHDILRQRLKNRAAIEGRVDDQDINNINTRIRIHEQKSLPIVDYYKAQHKLYRVDGGQNINRVTQVIQSIMDGLRP